MSGIYEKVIKNTKKIEALLEEKLTAEGKGLYEKTVSVEAFVDQDIVKKIRRIATIRNKLMHEDEFELANTDSFEEDCKDVIYYLSTTEFDQSITPKPAGIKQSRNARVCKSCGADTKPILHITSSGGIFTNESRRHICSICGETMYTSGGGITFMAFIIMCFIILAFIDGILKEIGVPTGLSTILALVSMILWIMKSKLVNLFLELWKRKKKSEKA